MNARARRALLFIPQSTVSTVLQTNANNKIQLLCQSFRYLAILICNRIHTPVARIRPPRPFFCVCVCVCTKRERVDLFGTILLDRFAVWQRFSAPVFFWLVFCGSNKSNYSNSFFLQTLCCCLFLSGRQMGNKIRIENIHQLSWRNAFVTFVKLNSYKKKENGKREGERESMMKTPGRVCITKLMCGQSAQRIGCQGSGSVDIRNRMVD